ncbi:MAG: methionine--tRNA ligase [Candidatus Korarchaeota archaeon]|nr:methionine--tRNA ligase [Thermoproteota archaeon]MCR8463057.1 methionine--tRNA ligase [Thermoproteota archaeon]MCR8470635.1 methionine--tRNA ligase [Thermoproteota archaeon]MCR8471603.1 methionine--tRNA ligase [Thermoproteota archaeon]MCR8473043.1 methionine--tRNA ligase [Thermoproteota archaeon]
MVIAFLDSCAKSNLLNNNIPEAAKPRKKFYITTPIYYPNRPPHIGSGYTTVVADILARYYKSLGYEVYFLTGTDEHGMKLYKEAINKGTSPREFVDAMVPFFKRAWEALDIEYSRFIRTTDPDHEETVKEIMMKVYEKGDVYEDKYKGLYCVECERYYTLKDLIEGRICPIHLKPTEYLEMEVYFFRLSKYKDALIRLFKENDKFVLPEEKKQYLISEIESEGLKDVAITRPKWYLPWGIECPWDKNHVLYVWVDALLNYVSGIGYVSAPDVFRKFWPPDLQLIGKDILWFHAVIWPALLLSAGLEIPRTIFTHGFLTVDGKKISKSLGTDIDPVDLVKKYGSDTVRYYLARAIEFGEDGDFSESDLIRYHNNELVNEIGNLFYRVLSLADRYFGGIVPESPGLSNIDEEFLNTLERLLREYNECIEELRIHHAAMRIVMFAQTINAYINKTEPWSHWKKGDKEAVARIVKNCLDWIYVLNAIIYPFMPRAADKIAKQLGLEYIPRLCDIRLIGNLNPGHKLGEKTVLFSKIQTYTN